MARLGPNERVLWEGTRAWKDYPGEWLLGGSLGVLGVVTLVALWGREERWLLWLSLLWLLPGVSVFLRMWLDKISRRYRVTTERATMTEGMIARSTSEVEIQHIRDIRLSQGLLQRILGTGSLEFSSAGRSGSEVVFRGIQDPEGVKETVRDFQREQQ